MNNCARQGICSALATFAALAERGQASGALSWGLSCVAFTRSSRSITIIGMYGTSAL